MTGGWITKNNLMVVKFSKKQIVNATRSAIAVTASASINTFFAYDSLGPRMLQCTVIMYKGGLVF